MKCTGQQAIRPSQHGVMKGRSHLTNQISCCDKVTCLLHKPKAVDVVYLESSEACDIVSHSIFLEKLLTAWMGRFFAG